MAEPRRRSACTNPFIVAITGLALVLAHRGTLMAQTSSGAAVPVSVHIGNASGLAPACAADSISHMFLTVIDIQAHQSGKGSAGWHDLTPGMPATGVQVDLLVPGEQFGEQTECFLTDVHAGSSGLPAGKYQQFRIFFLANASNSTGPENNACGSLGSSVFNCVESNGVMQPMSVPRGGIEIPSSQIARHGLTISPAQGGVDLDVDINACASISVKKKGRGSAATTTFALKPVLHSGEIELKPVVAGNVVLGAAAGGTISAANPTTAISGATVALEQRNGDNFVEGNPAPSGTTPSVDVESVVAVTQTDSNGHFVFCPVANGTYDLVVGSENMPSMANPSDATITIGVTVNANGGSNGLMIPLLPGSSSLVALEAQLTSQGASSATPATIGFHAAQTVTTGVEALIVAYSGTSPGPVPTSPDSTGSCSGNQCPIGTDCACVSIGVPSDNPVIGPAGGPYAAPAVSPGLYSVTATTSTCSPTNLVTDPEAALLPMPTLSFVNCQ